MNDDDWMPGRLVEQAARAHDPGGDEWKKLHSSLSLGVIKARAGRATVHKVLNTMDGMSLDLIETYEKWVMPKGVWLGIKKGSIDGTPQAFSAVAPWANFDDPDRLPIDGYQKMYFEATKVEYDAAGIREVFGLDTQGLGSPSPAQDSNGRNRSKAGAKTDVERWSRFAAALAFVSNHGDKETLRSRAKLYAAVSEYLVLRGQEPFDEKTVRQALDLARNWIEQGEDPTVWISSN